MSIWNIRSKNIFKSRISSIQLCSSATWQPTREMRFQTMILRMIKERICLPGLRSFASGDQSNANDGRIILQRLQQNHFINMNKLMLSSLALLCLLFVSSFAFAQDTLVKKTVFKDRVEVLLPASFKSMTAKEIEDFAGGDGPVPEEIWTNSKRTFNFRVVGQMQPVTEGQIPSFKNFQIANMKKEPGQEWIGDGVKKVNGKNVGYAKTLLTSEKQYNHFIFFSLDGKVTLFIFQCNEEDRADIEAIGDQIMDSIRVLDKK